MIVHEIMTSEMRWVGEHPGYELLGFMIVHEIHIDEMGG